MRFFLATLLILLTCTLLFASQGMYPVPMAYQGGGAPPVVSTGINQGAYQTINQGAYQ